MATLEAGRGALEALEAATSYGELVERLPQLTEPWGVKAVGFLRLDDGAPQEALNVGMEEWGRHYVEQQRYLDDPHLRSCHQKTLPYLWGTDEEREEALGGHARLLAELSYFGLPRGITCPVHGPGREFGVIGLWTDLSDRELKAVFRDARPQLHLFGHLLFEKLRALGAFAPSRSPRGDAALTPRQRECLTGAAQGETAVAIAERLGIGERTVTFHIEQAKQTLGARSIANAVAKALLRGDIEL